MGLIPVWRCAEKTKRQSPQQRWWREAR